MPEPSSRIWLLCPRLDPQAERGLGGRAPLGYRAREVRKAIRGFYQLPATHPLRIDLERIYPWLGKEWQGVFDLYAAGMGLKHIGAYASQLWQRKGRDRREGSRVVGQLVQYCLRLLACDLVLVSLPDLARTSGGILPGGREYEPSGHFSTGDR